jgi:uncharacterized lipoprotein YddW (UPF0748 family)
MRSTVAGVLLAMTLVIPTVAASPSAEYRAFWAESFNTPLATHADIDRVISAAMESNANALFVQIRRRGDSWYLESREPLTEDPGVGEPGPNGRPTFDPLQYLIDEAHAHGIEVHAFTIVGAVYREDPARRLPADRDHVFLHHIWDPQNGALITGNAQWATRALPPRLTGTTNEGRRFGREWYIDLGHPDAEAYTIETLLHLVRHYPIDGLHLDRIRYPEAPSGAGGGANVGYNEVSVGRFNARYTRVGQPAANDPLWNDWRREQVTNFLRRLYLNVKAIRPDIRVSAAVVCNSTGPHASGGFRNTEAYTRLFQDWESWAEEGLIDLITPMDYKREGVARQAAQFDDWSRFTVELAKKYNRLAVIGLGAYLNPVDATVQQARRARRAGADGVIFFSLATHTSRSRPAPEFFSTLRHRLFEERVPPPAWQPPTGGAMGFLSFDGADVTIEETTTGAKLTTRTDGGGFWGFPHLAPGTYRVGNCTLSVEAGKVAKCADGDVAHETTRN